MAVAPTEMATGGAEVVIRPSVLADANPIAATMRQEDIEECYAFGATPTWALLAALDQRNIEGTKCYTIEMDGVPCAMFGVTPHHIDEEFGTLWMLGNDKPFKHVFAFARASKPWVQEMCEDFAYVGNYIWEENKTAIAWLRWLGFEIMDDPEGTLRLGGKNFLFFVGPDKPMIS